MRKVKFVLVFVLLALLLSAGLGATLADGPPPTIGSKDADEGMVPIAQGDEALIKDASEYASAMKVDLDKAIRRLKLPGDVGDLNAGRAQASQVTQELGIRANSGINVFENRAELYVLDPVQLHDALRKANLQLPANVEVIKVDELPKEVTDIFGGKALRTCTSGFSVRNANWTKGITTAGHCSNWQTYNGTNLPFQSGTTGGIL